ncbi:hypothetical protein [Larkinella rosea]|uniref:Glycosyltransferase RgtA/B/C/D-like domain-containing protein n=1 Tax=Larkinella rosea TaxID=2025312 RepID=A0A3P1BS96_9BACT|nr:hypothetical protein [Larkinella rosea]RRB03917.1 hypothetical protein EHT25_10300 [Larkinella rosea]
MLAVNLLKTPIFWELAGWLAFLVVGGLCILSDFRRQLPRWQQIGLLLALVGFLVTNRLLLLFFNRELNPDESQLLSQAITLFHHPVYWQSTDGATMGPLSSYFASLPAYLGHPLDYIALRRTAFFCLLVTLISGYFTIENLFNPRTARLALLPGFAFLAFTYNHDFLHATNEQLSLALLGLTFWQYSRLWRKQTFDSVGGMAVLSFISSLIPFAKLQGVPTALVIVAAGLLGLWSQRQKLTAPRFWSALVGLVAGGVAFPLLVVFLTWQFGVFEDFKQFYLFGNLSYSAGASFWDYLIRFPAFVIRTTDFLVFLIPTFGLLIAGVLLGRKDEKKNGLLVFILASLVASGYAVIKPGSEFMHYLLYLVTPVCLLNAWFIDRLMSPVFTGAWVALIGLCFGVNAAMQHGKLALEPLNAYRLQPFQLQQLFISPTSQAVQKYARSGEDLVVWGWAPRYNVEMQMPQGVCDNHTIRCIIGGAEAQKIHRARYIRNITASRPPVFLDAVGPNSFWLSDRATQGYENFPELRNFIDTNYRFAGETDKNRIYIRTDRLSQQN